MITEDPDNHKIIKIKSNIDSRFNVYLIYPEHSEYAEVKKIFEKFGHAVLLTGSKNIFVDGVEVDKPYFTMDHLIAIQGHEIAHSILKHRGGLNKQKEMEADIAGMQILKSKGFTKAYNLLYTRFKTHYGAAALELPDNLQRLLAAYLR